jgi:hypothetical protein
VPQTVTVTGADDAVDDGDIAYSIVTGPVGGDDATYAAIDPADVAATNADDDAAGIEVTPVSGSARPRRAAAASFSVVLTSRPDRRCGDPGRIERSDRGHDVRRQPDVHRRRLEPAADRHRDGCG